MADASVWSVSLVSRRRGNEKMRAIMNKVRRGQLQASCFCAFELDWSGTVTASDLSRSKQSSL
jgi:hypothetical protein